MMTSLFALRWPVLAAILGASTLSACSPSTAPPTAETVRPAYVVEARAGSIDRLAFVGEVRSTRRAELAFVVNGRVASVHAEAGDAVRAGQVLARLDPQPLKAQLAAAAGEAARAQALLGEVRQRAERLRIAQQASATSAAEAGAVQAELTAAEASLRSATAQQELAAWSLVHTTLAAPVDGVVGVRGIEVGQAAGPGAPAFVIDGAGRELSVLLPAAMVLKPGQAVTLRQGSTDVPSRVLRLAGRLEAGGLRRVHLAVPEQAMVGSTWSVAIGAESAKAALQVPLRAVLPAPQAGQGHVLRIARDGRTTEKVAVRLGSLHGDWIDIDSGLAAGDRVVIAGAAAIAPGTVVKPVTPGQEPRS